MIDLETFEARLWAKGFAIAPNGASYKATSYGASNKPSIDRTTSEGNREHIVGFNAILFADRMASIRWAIADGRHEIGQPGQPLSARVAIC